jgi:uncharacterized protein (DUF736 family)
MKIGNFKYDRKADTYTGDIATLTFQRSGVQLKPVEKSGDKQPDYRLFGDNGSVEFGAAWKRKGEKGEFLSVEIDDPALAGTLYGAIFTEKDGTAQLVWSRSSKKKAKDE